MSTCHKRKAGQKGSRSGAGGVQCHVTKGIAEERRGGGSRSGRRAGVGSGSGRRVGVGSIRGSPYRNINILYKNQPREHIREVGVLHVKEVSVTGPRVWSASSPA